MKFPNVAKGIKKLYLGEILTLLGVIIGVGLMILLVANGFSLGESGAAFAEKAEATGMAIPFVIYFVGTLILFLVGYILCLAGITQASHDEESFKRALWAALLGVAVVLLSAVLQQNNAAVSKWLEVASTVCSMTVTLLVLDGIKNVADKLGNKEMSALSRNCSRIVLYPFILSLLAEVIVAVLSLNDSTSNLFKIAIWLMDIVAYLLYLRVLAKAKVMQ